MAKKWEDLYSKTIEDLKNFKRPMVNLSSEDFLEIRDLWNESLQRLKDPSFKEEQKEKTLAFLEKIFCLLDHSQKPSVLFDSLYEESFKVIKKPELVIYLLSVSRKHLIEKKFLDLPTSSGTFLEISILCQKMVIFGPNCPFFSMTDIVLRKRVWQGMGR